MDVYKNVITCVEHRTRKSREREHVVVTCKYATRLRECDPMLESDERGGKHLTKIQKHLQLQWYIIAIKNYRLSMVETDLIKVNEQPKQYIGC